MEAARRTQLAKGEVGIRDMARIPTLAEFAEVDGQAQQLVGALDQFGVVDARHAQVDLGEVIDRLAVYGRGWRGYFGFCETPSVLRDLEQWLRRRLRSLVWKQWKRGRRRYAELIRRGVQRDLAAQTAGSSHGPWRLAASPALHLALPTAYFAALGLPPLHVSPIA